MVQAVELTLILPAYNERASIAATIEEAFAYFERRSIVAEIIVAADGNDGTREIVREMAAQNPYLRVIGHEERLGKGRGIREAVKLARGRIIGYADADNKVPIEEYSKTNGTSLHFRAHDEIEIPRMKPVRDSAVGLV